MMGSWAFSKWEIHFIVPIDPSTMKTCAQYIIIGIDYVTKWVEVKAPKKNDAYTTAKFLFENLFMRYNLSIEILRERGSHFLN